MTVSPSLVGRIASTHRFQAENIEKVLRLKQLLVEFDRHPVLKGKLVLRGGTAVNLFYLDLARLSVDIDLNYIGQIERTEMLTERPLIVAAIEQVCRALEYQVQRVTDDHALVELSLGFRSHVGRPDHVQVEVNFLYRVCALPIGLRAAARLEDEGVCSFPVLSVEELMAGKLRAMIDRQHPRDLYDLYRFKRMNPHHDTELLRKLAVLFSCTLPHDLRKYTVERCARVLKADLERLLYPLLKADDRPNADEMLGVIQPVLAAVLDPAREAAFLDAMASGRYEPELLFRDQLEIGERIRRHPALVWKAENVARHRSEND